MEWILKLAAAGDGGACVDIMETSKPDDLGGEPMAEVGVRWRLHAASLAHLQTGDHRWLA